MFSLLLTAVQANEHVFTLRPWRRKCSPVSPQWRGARACAFPAHETGSARTSTRGRRRRAMPGRLANCVVRVIRARKSVGGTVWNFMSFNTFGHLFRVTTFGESHGSAIGCVVDGCPPRI